MAVKLTNALLKKACEIAAEHARMTGIITEAFNDRYGMTHSDVDADSIIDCLDYGLGSITLKECDEAMAEAGHPHTKGERS